MFHRASLEHETAAYSCQSKVRCQHPGKVEKHSPVIPVIRTLKLLAFELLRSRGSEPEIWNVRRRDLSE